MNVQSSPLAVERLRFRYRTAAVHSLTDISFAVMPGELILVAGGSGSGKSTLLRCLNGLIPRSYTGDLSGAIAIDLAVRFVPSLAGDFSTTLDAQRARGYELERAGGIFKAIRNMAPLVVPITISAILKGEDEIDAMNLHAFGTGHRTWVQELRYQPRDYAVIALSLGLLALGIVLRVLGLGGLWVPGWLLALAH